jgi:dehydrogenase/reductase SDR family protein 7B
MTLVGKTVWVTGATSGIGLAVAIALAKKGAKLILSARSFEKLESIRLDLERPNEHKSIPLDFNSLDSMLDGVKRALENGLAPDILINNAGISQRGQAIDVNLEVTREVMEVNFFATIALTQSLLPTLIANKGMVATIASVAGKVGGQGMSSYAASKHAIVGYMDCLRAEEQMNGLHVLTVCPGFVSTNISINARTSDGSKYGEMAESIASGISAESCADKIVEAIIASKNEIYIGKGISRWAPVIKRFFPSLLMYLAGKKNIR